MESTESGIGFQEYWQILKRRWLPALAVFASVVALTTYGHAEGKKQFMKQKESCYLRKQLLALL
jgi:uncharacterized protein involved in exopolysaccharide biosynthesis